MADYDGFLAAVLQTLKGTRLGRPCALRWAVESSERLGDLTVPLADYAAQVSDWLQAPPLRVWAVAPRPGGLVSHWRFADGQTALLSLAADRQSPAGQFTLVGNHGVADWVGPLPPPGHAAKAQPDSAHYIECLQRSLAQGQAIDLTNNAALGRTTWPAPTDVFDARPVRGTPPPWGVLLIAGGQTHQENYALALRADPRCRLVGLADAPDVSPWRRAQNLQLAEQLGIPYWNDLGQALARNDVHIVSICAEPDRRGKLIVACARAGKHLYLDKPLAATADEGRAIVEAVRASGVVAHMFSLATLSPAQRVAAAWRSLAPESLACVHADLFFAKGRSGSAEFAPRVEQPAPTNFQTQSGKREWHNVGVYPVVQLLWLLRQRVRQVYATTSNFFFAESQQQGQEDFAQAMLTLEDGTVATISAGRTGWHSHPASGVQRTVLVGARRTLTCDAHTPRLEVWSDAPPWQAPAESKEDPLGFWSSTQAAAGLRAKQLYAVPPDVQTDAGYFLDCVAQGRPSEVGVELAAEADRVLLAAYASAATGNVIEFTRT